jgi:hypothetical protein
MVTLESAKQAFDEWRATKRNINTPAPVELWDMVNRLLPTHKKSELCKVLAISSHQIQSHCTTDQMIDDQALTPSQPVEGFIEATPPAVNATMAELTLKEGSRSLHLCVPTTVLGEVLPMLGALL